jgi:superfamily I DNA/RNA helicase
MGIKNRLLTWVSKDAKNIYESGKMQGREEAQKEYTEKLSFELFLNKKEWLNRIDTIKENHVTEINLLKKEIKEIKEKNKDALYEKDIKITELENYNSDNLKNYQALRDREENLYVLISDFWNIIDSTGVKIQETFQPFYRLKGKVEKIRNDSNGGHIKYLKKLKQMEE